MRLIIRFSALIFGLVLLAVGLTLIAARDADAAPERIAFTARHGNAWNIYTMLPDGRARRVLTRFTTNTGHAAYSPVWSPDGIWLAFGWDDVYRIHADGSAFEPITTTNATLYNTHWRWSPDGGALAYTTSTQAITSQIVVVDLEQMPAMALSPIPDAGEFSWSPDGQWIVFANQYWIFRARPDGGDRQQLTPDPGTYGCPQWSPDGSQIAYVRNHSTLVVIPAAGGEAQVVGARGAAVVDHCAFAWSPDGTWIAFAASEPAGRGLYRARPDGTALEKLTDLDGYISSYTSSPDGEWLAFALTQRGPATIYRVHWDGTGLQQLTSGAYDCITPDWARLPQIAFRAAIPLSAAGLALVVATRITGRRRKPYA